VVAKPQPTAKPGEHNQPPELGGQRLTAGGRTVQLPPDVFVVGGVISEPPEAFGRPTRTGATPVTVIDYRSVILQRGHSRVRVGLQSGRVFPLVTAPGEEGAFDFLKEALG
jgi:hypothetical protein